MIYQELFRQLHQAPAPLITIAQLLQSPRARDKSAEEQALVALRDAMTRRRIGRALSAARTLLVLGGPSKAIERMRRAGILRASSFGFDSHALERVLTDWISHADEYGLMPSDVAALSSAVTLCRLAPSVRTLHQRLISLMRAERSAILKSLLAEVDAAFADPDPVDVGYGEAHPVSREELAEAFSYLLCQFNSHIGLSARQFALTDAKAGYDPRYRTVLGDALKICRYREAEVLLEAFPYQARATPDGVCVSAIDPALERSLRLGYMQREMQSRAGQHYFQRLQDTSKYASVKLLAEGYFKELGERVCRLQRWPISRYVVELPIDGSMADVFAHDAPFLEDWIGCTSLALEEYLAREDVPHQLISGNITVMDLFKVQRVFRFHHLGLKAALDRHAPFSERTGLHRASCLPVMERTQMLVALSMAVGPDKAPEVLALLTADPTAAGLDIQDAPIIAAGEYFMVSPAVLASSNLPRNILSRLHERLVPAVPGLPDPMQTQLVQALREAGFLAVEECHLKRGKRNTLETDVLAYCAGHLFIFECKNTYHPCNVYELRNSYNAMVEAANQLSLRQKWLADPAHQREVFGRLGWTVPAKAVVHTCVALGNRVFTGYMCDGHPVRQVHELLNVLQGGEIEFNKGERVRWWAQAEFGVDDLLAHLAGTAILADMHGALDAVEALTPIGDQYLIEPTYVLDLERFKSTVLARYPRILKGNELGALPTADASSLL